MNYVLALIDWMGIDPNDAKLQIVHGTGLAKDALHIYVGLTLFILFALTRQRRFASRLAWLLVMLITLTGEIVDYAVELRTGVGVDAGAHWHDLWNTMMWPSLLFLLAHFVRLSPHRDAPAPPDVLRDGSGDGADQTLE